MAQFPRLDNAAGVWKLSDVYDQIYNGTWPNNAAVGLFGGSAGVTPGAQKFISKINIATIGDATVFGDLPTAAGGQSGIGSLTRGIFAGTNSGPSNAISYVTFSTEGNASDFGDLTTARYSSGCSSNSTRGISGGGDTPGTTNVIDYITMATLGNATDFGDLTVARTEPGGFSNSIRSIFYAGGTFPTTTNVIDFVTIASTGNATDFGDATAARRDLAHGASSSTRGLIAGGSGDSDVIEFVTIDTTGNGTDFGDLTLGRGGIGAATNSVRAVFGGGRDASPSAIGVDIMDYVTIASTGNAADFGNLAGQQSFVGGCSNAHGGLTDGYQGTRPPVFLNSGDQAIMAAGETPASTNIIQSYKISTTGNATDFGDCTINRNLAASISNETRQLVTGNYGSPSTTVDYVTVTSQGNAANFGNLITSANDRPNTAGNSTRGIFGGGELSVAPFALTNVIQYIEYSSLGNFADFGDLTVARYNGSGVNSTTRGVFVAGLGPAGNVNTMDYVTIATTGNATDFGDLSSASRGSMASSSSTRGVIAVGQTTPTVSNVIDYITIASAGNATDFGDLTLTRGKGAGASNSTRGTFAGGNGPPITNTIDYVTIASTGNAIDFGDLTNAQSSLGGSSNGHGGLDGATLTPTPDRGLFMGGNTGGSYTNGIDYITVSSAGNAADFGDLTLSIGIGTGGASSTRAIQAGGSVGGSPLGGARNDITAITIATLGNASDFGDLTVTRFFGSNGNTGNSTRAVFNGGEAGAPVNTIYNVIDYITIASVGNAIDFGDATVTVRSRAGMTSPTRAVFAGGRGPAGNTNVIDYITIAATGNATDFGDLLGTNRYAGGLSSSTRGVVAGGSSEPGAATDIIQYITIGSTGNSIDFGDLTTISNSNTALSNNTRGVVAMSATPSTSNVLEYITIATAGNSIDFGDLTVAKANSMGACANHGGLQ